MKKLLLLSFLFISVIGFSQDTDESTAEDAVKEGWTRAGNASLLFNQAAFNNEWTGGGVSNISGNLSLTYEMNYNKGGLVWDNILLAEYGLTKLKEDDFARKTNDRLAINSILGKQIKETNWYYSMYLNFKTQMDSGYEDSDAQILDDNGDPVIINGNPLFETTREKTTHFFSPAYLQVGPGLLWKKSENLKVNISPLASKFIFVHDEFTNVGTDQTTIDAFNNAGGYFGVEANETMRFEFGASIEAYAKFNLMENIVFENFVNLYSNYLEDPQNVDVDYTANIIFTVNKWITANITFQAIYDDNAVQGFQIRETLGVGVAHSF
jgi:hypothetical protein|tara:strand:+ start:8600 stop:9571 length:972 start_codon:yes stop_codon:yes gene_type:complete